MQEISQNIDPLRRSFVKRRDKKIGFGVENILNKTGRRALNDISNSVARPQGKGLKQAKKKTPRNAKESFQIFKEETESSLESKVIFKQKDSVNLDTNTIEAPEIETVTKSRREEDDDDIEFDNFLNTYGSNDLRSLVSEEMEKDEIDDEFKGQVIPAVDLDYSDIGHIIDTFSELDFNDIYQMSEEDN